MSKEKDIESLKEKVASGNRLIDHEGLADIYGHVSARIPDSNKLLIKPAIKPLKDIMPEDIITVDMDNYELSVDMTDEKFGEIPAPPSETILHIAVYQKREDIASVIHTHQPLATCFGTAGTKIIPIHNQFSAFSPATPIYEKSDIITTSDLAHEVADALGDNHAILLKGHGVVIVGESIESAVVNTIFLERAAWWQFHASLIGKPKPLNHEYCKNFYHSIDKVRAVNVFARYASKMMDK